MTQVCCDTIPARFRMWPMLLDYTRDECKRILRKLELEAYASVVSAFRAQGDLSKNKKKMLQELSSTLSISLERHRAEVRRAVNDEHLNTVADRIAGPNTGTEWAIEGRRLIPLMPRLVPQTAFTAIANNVANIQAAKNAAMLPPSATGNKEAICNAALPTATAVTSASTVKTTTTPPCGSAPTPPPKQPQGVNTGSEGGVEEESSNKKRKPSSSIEPASSSPQKVILVSTPGTTASPSILQRSLNVPVMKTVTPTTTSLNQARCATVMSVASGTTTSAASSITTTASMALASHPVSLHVTNSLTTQPATVVGSTGTGPVVSPSRGVVLPAPSANILPRPRTKTLPPPRQAVRPRPNIVIPLSSHGQVQVLGSGNSFQFPSPLAAQMSSGQVPSAIQGVQVKPATPLGRTMVQYRQEGAVKFITQSIPMASGKLLPKLATSGTSTSPLVVMSGSCTNPTSGKIIAAPIAGSQPQIGTRVVNVISANQPQAVRMVSKPITPMGSRPIQACAVKMPASAGTSVRPVAPGAKPNVIVVHKAQMWPQTQGQSATIVVSSSGAVAKLPTEAVQEAVTYFQRQERSKQAGGVAMMKTVMPARTATLPTSSSSLIATGSSAAPAGAILKQPGPVASMLQRTCVRSQNETDMINLAPKQVDTGSQKSSLLADLIQAAGILPENSCSSASVPSEPVTPSSEIAPPFPVTIGSSSGPVITDVRHLESVVDLENTLVIDDIPAEAPVLELNPWENQLPVGEKVHVEVTSTEKGTLSPPSASTLEETSDPGLNTDPNMAVSIQEINLPLEQLQEGEILEIQTQDAELLNQGRLSKEVIDLLQQAGLQIQEVNVTPFDASGGVQSSEVSSSQQGHEISVENQETATNEVSQPSQNDGSPPMPEVVYVTSEAEAVHSASGRNNVERGSKTPSDCGPDSTVSYAPVGAVADEKAEHGIKIVSVRTIRGEDDELEGALPVECIVDPVPNPSSIAPKQTVQEELTLGLPVSTQENKPDEETAKTSPVRVDVMVIDRDDNATVESNVVVSNVTVEHSGLDTSSMQLEDFASQQVESHVADYLVELVAEDIQSSPSADCPEVLPPNDVSSQIQDDPSMPTAGSSVVGIAGKRKRRTVPEEQTLLPVHLTGWARVASGLLERVCRHRALGRPKGELAAAHWFMQPVNPEEAPGYYDIVKQPMDFSTIKKKLESGCYRDLSDFHADMMVVKENCELYNPAEHEARQDCQTVFSFYLQEYNRLVEKWQKSHLLKRPKTGS